ncbi:MAG: hypothetical protein AB7P49_13945 [Bdellovibrionales bacterium]
MLKWFAALSLFVGVHVGAHAAEFTASATSDANSYAMVVRVNQTTGDVQFLMPDGTPIAAQPVGSQVRAERVRHTESAPLLHKAQWSGLGWGWPWNSYGNYGGYYGGSPGYYNYDYYYGNQYYYPRNPNSFYFHTPTAGLYFGSDGFSIGFTHRRPYHGWNYYYYNW